MNLKSIRQRLGLSQRRLAAKAGMSYTYFCNLENGKADPSLGTIRRLARALGLRVQDIINEHYAIRGGGKVTYEAIYAIRRNPSLTVSKAQNRLEAMLNKLILQVRDKPPRNKQESDSYWYKAVEISREICRLRRRMTRRTRRR